MTGDCASEEPVPLRTKVAALRRPDTYPGDASSVDTVQTHMAYVFLVGELAYKMKKPARHRQADFRTLEARRRDGAEEVRLNRRLAPDVYIGITPLCVSPAGGLAVGIEGTPVEWLVQMRRLDPDRMLDRAIRDGRTRAGDMERVAEVLARFYSRQPPARSDGEAHVAKLKDEVSFYERELQRPEFGLDAAPIRRCAEGLQRFVQGRSRLLTERVHQGRIVDAHGDLRPEHVCLERRPVIIDCLEFDRELRILDAASELSFLSLECERLGGEHLVEPLWRVYGRETGDRPELHLRHFYVALHAFIRATVAAWHLDSAEADEDREHRKKAERYLSRSALRLEQLVD